MSGVNVEYINPFLMAGVSVLKGMCQVDVKIGKPNMQASCNFQDDTLVIIIGITGEMKGQVMLAFTKEVYCDIATRMVMYQVNELDELAMSAICELGNMIMGNAATVFSTKGIGIDITPPTMCKGNVNFTSNTTNICIPLFYDDNNSKKVDINISVRQD